MPRIGRSERFLLELSILQGITTAPILVLLFDLSIFSSVMIFCYSGSITGLFIYQRYSNKYSSLILAIRIKVYFDILVAIAILFEFNQYNITFFFPWFFILLYSIYNILELRSRAISIFLRISLLVFIILSFNIYTLDIENRLVLLIFCSCLYLSYLVLEQLFISKLHSYEERNKKIEDALRYNKNEFLESSSAQRNLAHDINNYLIYFTYGQSKYNSGEHKKAEELFERGKVEIQNKLAEFRESNYTKLEIREYINHLCKSLTIPFTMEIGNSVIIRRTTWIKHVIENIISNSVEAYIRKEGILKNFEIKFREESGRLYIEDNSGGFDIDGIQYGISSKEDCESHGIFLASMLDDSKTFQVPISIECIPDGTRFIIDYSSLLQK